ncbi:MAG: tetratricopeptide repeat protein [Pyrinomonadaceae bacterium]
MKRTTSSAFALTLCLLLAIATAHAAPAKDAWTSVRSRNFHLIGNAGEKEIRQVATRLEQFRDVFTRLFPQVAFNSPVPTTVVVFKSDSSFKPFKPVVDGKISDVAGYFQSNEDVNYITLTTEKRAENPYRTIYHEYVHLLVDNNVGKVSAPPWFNEGLAEYYSTFDVDDQRKVRLGALIENHLLLLRQQQMFPLKTLLDVDYYSLHRNQHDARGIFYAQSWALVHYLIQSDGGKRLPQMARYFDLLANNKPTEPAFREAFQMDFAGMEKELKNYVRQNSFRLNVATFERKLEYDATMQATPLSDAEAAAYLGDLLLHTNRPEDAVARLEQALALDPKSAMAHASLGMARLRQKRFDEAKQHLRQAVALNAQNYLAHYYHAYTLSREGMSESGSIMSYPDETAGEMRAALAKAIELKPDFAESYRLLAFVNLVSNERLDESVELLKRARALVPGNQEYALVLAQIYMRQENFDAARQTIEPLARAASEPQMRASAQSILNAISTMQEQSARFKAMREEAANAGHNAGQTSGESGHSPRLKRRGEEGAPPPPQDGRTEEELVAEAMSEAIHGALRKPEGDEVRIRGLLTRIECGPKGITFHVKAGDRLLKLHGPDFNSLHIMAFTPEAGNELTCGPRKVESAAVFTYRPAQDARAAKVDGQIVALEFVPAKFDFKQ